jgi:hypothetical protein
MELRIRSIILWPKDPDKVIRKIDFKLDEINVITGQSQTGKSALIPIIDYCLGSSKCAIPVGIIRDKTEWFGLLLENGSNQLMLARREPGEKFQTSEMYMQESSVCEIMDRPSKNCNSTSAKNRLNELAHLPSLSFEEKDIKSSFKERPSIRDMSAFLFQPQHIIANPYTLFYKADTYEHQLKLKTIFPYVLGAIDEKILRLRHELKDLETTLRIKQNELMIRKNAANAWLGDISAFYSQAREYNLLPEAPDSIIASSKLDIDIYIKHLKNVIKASSQIDMPKVSVGNTELAVKELMELKLQEDNIVSNLEIYRAKLLKMERLSERSKSYRTALNSQEERLEGLQWFSECIKEKSECPFCGSLSNSVEKEMANLLKLSNELVSSSRLMDQSYPIFDREIVNTKKEIRELEDLLNKIRTHREKFENKAKRQRISDIFRYIGRLEEAIDNFDKMKQGSNLNGEIDILESQIKANRDERDLNKEEERQRLALSKISSLISIYANILDLERKDDSSLLDIVNLTIKFSSILEKRQDFLWEIGSGSNWMGYHLSTLLALHEYFIGLELNPVPQFLVVDQPSQVYFPERWPRDPDPKNPKAPLSELTSEDIERTRKIFKALSVGLYNTNKKLQIIVIEHADEIAWDGIKNIHLVERWRGGKALIPQEWLD